jgi:hypothetical protein
MKIIIRVIAVLAAAFFTYTARGVGSSQAGWYALGFWVALGLLASFGKIKY